MSMPPRLVRVLAGNRSIGRCKYCREFIEWAKTARGNPIPLNTRAKLVRHEREETTGIRYDVLEPGAAHIATCVSRPKKVPKSPARHAWAGGRR